MIKSFQDFLWGLSLKSPSKLRDNEFKVLKNMYYNEDQQLQTRRGYRTFWNEIWSSPITSFFSYRRDDNQESITVWSSWTQLYAYDWTTWNSIATNLMEYETMPWRETDRTRRDFAVYKNVVYMCDWVNPYCKYDWATYEQISVVAALTCTFDHTTDYVNRSSHWRVDWDNIFFTDNWTLPAEITAFQVYYVKAVDWNNFQIMTTVDWTAINFTDNWSWTNQYRTLAEPRCRYLQYLQDQMIWWWEDANPITLYYTNAVPTNADNINQNLVVVWWDEQWKINWLSEYANTILVFKDNKIYWADLNTPSIDSIDTQFWGYSDRSIQNIGNSLVYLTEWWVDSLKKRSGVDWIWAITWASISDNVKALFDLIVEKEYNSNVWYTIKKLNNYYFVFDTNWDNIPDTRLVYNAKVSAWSQYTLPPAYDIWEYLTADNVRQYLFASASWWQMFQFEYWFDDDWIAIDTELETKDFDFNDPAQEKIFTFLDVTWYKQEWWVINVEVIIDWEVITEAQITDSNIDKWSVANLISVDPLWTASLWANWADNSDDLPLYYFTIKIPFYYRGKTIAVWMNASWVQRIPEKMRVEVNGEVVPVFSYWNIL